MKPMRKIYRIVMFFILGFGLLMAGSSLVYAKEDAVIIKIGIEENSPEAPFTVTPDETTIEKQTIVIWVNFIDGPEIDVEFKNPDETIAATTDHKGFYKDDKGVFSAKYMPYIATSSIRFIKCGEFIFTVKSQDGQKTATGKIIVK